MPKIEQPDYVRHRILRRAVFGGFNGGGSLNGGLFGGDNLNGGGGVNVISGNSNGGGNNIANSNANQPQENNGSQDSGDGTTGPTKTVVITVLAQPSPVNALSPVRVNPAPTDTEAVTGGIVNANLQNPSDMGSSTAVTETASTEDTDDVETYVTYGVATYTAGTSVITTQFPLTIAVRQSRNSHVHFFRPRKASPGAIAGAVLGSIALFALTFVFCILLPKLRKRLSPRRLTLTRLPTKRKSIGAEFTRIEEPDMTEISSPTGIVNQFPTPPVVAPALAPLFSKWLTYPHQVAKKGLSRVIRPPPVTFTPPRVTGSSSPRQSAQSAQSYDGPGSYPYEGFSLRTTAYDYDDPSPSEPDTDAYRDTSDGGLPSPTSSKR